MKKIILLTLISFMLFSCNKQSNIEPEELLHTSAGTDVLLQDEFCVELKASPLKDNQKGQWKIVDGLIDDLVYIEDPDSAQTNFHALPGEEYILTWTLSEGERSVIDSVQVSFKPLVVKIESDINPNYSTRRHIWVNSEYEGQWLIQGNYYKFITDQGQNLLNDNSKYITVYGNEKSTIKAIWKIQYGSVSFSDTLVFNTGEYAEYEVLEDLNLLKRPNYYTIEDGHITRIVMNHGIGWKFMDPENYPNFKALRYLRYLDLSGERLSDFSDSIAVFYKNLEHLNLDNNFITKIPNNIGLLKKLKVLKLFGNKINTVPEAIGDLESLESLDLVGNSFTKLPEAFGNLVNLKRFTIGDINLTSLPISFGNLKSLEYFHVGSIKDKLPDSFCNLSNLEDLHITYFNEFVLKSLPDEFGKLKRLKRLEIMGYNTFDELPISFCDLDSLQELEIMSCLKSLPDNFWQLKSIKSVKLINTELKTLPNPYFGNSTLNNLTIAFNQENRVNSFNLPNDIHLLVNLETISIGYRKMDAIPDNIGKLANLKYLHILDCDLETLPSSIGELSNLENINIYSNKLTKLPTSFQKLSSLTYLNIWANWDLYWQIEEIKGWFPNITLIK